MKGESIPFLVLAHDLFPMMKKNCALLFLLLLAIISHAQKVEVSGVVKDAVNGESLPGAIVTYDGGNGIATDIDGRFSIQMDKGTHTINVSFVGMAEQQKQVSVSNARIELEFLLETTQLKEVEIIADIAIGRKTPVAYSDISSIKIREELGTRDIPMLLNSTPGIYATQGGGGDGDSRVNIRGFQQKYVAVMVDGIPMNDMENGSVFWSNWFGLDLVTQKMQIQRGLGASKLAIPSIGGTINILTQGIEQKKSIMISSELGNNQNLRETIGLNSGRLKGGWGITAAFSAKKNNGWVENLRSRQLFYFLKLQKEFRNQSLSLSIMGSPQEHGQRSLRLPIYYYDKSYAAAQGIDTSVAPGGAYPFGMQGDYGLNQNPHWGYLTRNRGGESNAEEFIADRKNFYHKPIINLKHFWSLGERLALSNIAYASFGNGGRTQLNSPVYDLKTGQSDFNKIYYSNTHGTGFVPAYDLNYVDDTSQYKSRNFIYSNINNHFWIGVLSTFKFKLNKRFEFSGGFDGRYYYTDRYQAIYDLLGGDYAVVGGDANTPEDRIRREDGVYDYKIRTYVKQGGLFLLAEYQKNDWSAFINVTGSINAYNRTDYFALKNPDGKYQTSGWKSIPGGTVKGGLSYNLSKNQSVFVNGGYLSRAQMVNTVFAGTSLNQYQGVKNEVIIAKEIGYMFNNGKFRAVVNAYNTMWKNKPVLQQFQSGTEVYQVNVPGMNALHQGAELETEYKLLDKLTVDAILSLGNWRWISNGDAIVTNESGSEVVGRLSFNAKDVKVGDAAQTQASVGIRYAPFKGFYIKPRITYFDNYYSNFDPETLQGENSNRQSWKVPAYYQVDVNMGYTHLIGQKKSSITLRVNLMNVTNAVYVSDAYNNDYGNGFDAASAGVFMGLGFRWNVGVTYTF